MKIIYKPIYKCEFCSKLYSRKYFAEKHEIKCNKNPTNKMACYDCKYLKSRIVDYMDIMNYDEQIVESVKKVKVFYCEKKSVFLIPPKAFNKGNTGYDLGDEENIKMINKCMDFKIKIIECFDF